MKEKVSFLKNRIDKDSPNKNIVPITTIIDKEGKIAAKNLRGLDLDLKINELINAKR